MLRKWFSDFSEDALQALENETILLTEYTETHSDHLTEGRWAFKSNHERELVLQAASFRKLDLALKLKCKILKTNKVNVLAEGLSCTLGIYNTTYSSSIKTHKTMHDQLVVVHEAAVKRTEGQIQTYKGRTNKQDREKLVQLKNQLKIEKAGVCTF